MNFSKGKVKVTLWSTNSALHHEGVWGSGCIDPHFLDLGTNCSEWSASRPGRFTPGERAPDTHWVDPRSGLDNVEKKKFLTLPELEFRPLGRPAPRQSLYRLRWPGSSWILVSFKILTAR
jgi:hypothetical protein